MEYYLSSLGQSSQPALAARSCQGTAYLVGSEGQTGSLLPTRSEWGSRQASGTVAGAANNIQRASALGFEEGGWNTEVSHQQESGGMEGGRVVAPPPPPPPPPHPPLPSLAIYPERPGVQDCPFYLRTGTCGFGQQCKFNHPPNGRASAGYPSSFSTTKGGKLEYPERPGQQECPYYMRTGTCKFGATCKFHHPSLKLASNSIAAAYQLPRPPLNSLGYPLRPGEKECAYYMRNRVCKFGVTCRFHHPQLPPTNGAGLVQPRPGPLPHTLVNSTPPPHLPFPIPASLQPWQLRSMTTRFQVFPHQQVQYLPPPPAGAAAAPSSSPPHVFSQQQQHHPHQQAPRPPQPANANPGPPYFYTAPGGPGSGAAGPLAEPNAAVGSGGGMATAVPPYFAGHGTPHFMQSVPCGPMGMPAQAGGAPTGAAAGQAGAGGVGQMVYLQQAREFPERPGQPECTFYMRTGDCKYGMSCRYHHPKDRGVPAAQCALSSMGLPLRPGQPQCSFYTRYGVCKFGHTCKFDHPVGLDYSPSASSLVDLPVAPVSYTTGGTSPLGNQSAGDGRNGAGEMDSSAAQERREQLLIGEGDEREKQEEDVSSQGEDMGGKNTNGGGSATADGGEEAGATPAAAAAAAAQTNASALAGGGTHQSAGGGMYCTSMTGQTGGNGSGSSTG